MDTKKEFLVVWYWRCATALVWLLGLECIFKSKIAIFFLVVALDTTSEGPDRLFVQIVTKYT